MQSPSFIEEKLPVFSFPSSLNFYSDDQSSHKQILTLYNPYDFPLKFKVLCTAPQKFTVVDPEGSIRPQCCIDIIVRHNDITQNNYGVTDKFRIQVQEHGQHQFLGKKDISATLYPSKPDTNISSSAESEQFEQLSKQSMPMVQARQYSINGVQGRSNSGLSVIVILAAIVCIIALMLPTKGESVGSLPPYVHLSVHQKLIAAYTLGLVTMVIFRT
ncbi:motile sperm domain-containing protein 1-like [Limulus polyphemus]|uniref:Motile sperm domain-containing protein 1-like n=1 Tax=Limulus polyphemus TaxID=6850 RepID=A0ABM1BEU2_LIMPO|nr:motile sperm domain-containing protein 1-like [Limulus polyphemus]XP_013780557.1 motile sperm domain-containing protein 1-like [Limulus polyphemus]XP_013780558.1 motile sperm domain-containing protein 1-like [Limulus polyphemus]XP_022248449.1 motile sperm domain-containing protein 1-like [Limulus polyphemus]XP_022248450.1 motile sperm domain-containing protein 1-like [Limulus polyphemus]